MHELAVCQSLIQQVEAIAQSHYPSQVALIIVKIGPLSGIEADLLINAFSIAKMGTASAHAELKIEKDDILIFCQQCQKKYPAQVNNLSCPQCKNWRTQLVSGNDMLLQSVELIKPIRAPIKEEKTNV